MSISASFKIIHLHGEDINATMDFASREGWNCGLHDSLAFHAADHDGFYAGMIDGKMVGCIFAVNFGAAFAFLGRYIVDKQSRGLGYGSLLWETALEHIGERPAGLNAAPSMAEKYTRHGFRTANTGARFAAISRKNANRDERIVTLNELPFGDILAFDRRYHPADREKFLSAWLAMPESRSFAGVDAQGRLRAYGLIRRFNSGWKIGPLFADDPEYADAVYSALEGTIPANEPVFIDCAMDNRNAMSFVARHNMVKVFENFRMYRGTTPLFDPSGIYSHASNELG